MVTSGPTVEPRTSSLPGRRVSFGLATTIVAVPTGIALANPMLATVLASAELALLLTVLLTAVFAPAAISERAFRLLRWMTGRPEPDQPTDPAGPHNPGG